MMSGGLLDTSCRHWIVWQQGLLIQRKSKMVIEKTRPKGVGEVLRIQIQQTLLHH